MPNWVERVETAMEGCPSPEEIAKEVEASGGKLSPIELWLKKQAGELKDGKLDREVPGSNSDPQG